MAPTRQLKHRPALLLLLALAWAGFAAEPPKAPPIARLMTIGIDGSDPHLVYEGTGFEAPNWTPDGRWLVFNNGGALWRIAATGGTQPEKIPTGDVRGVNNDHVLSPDGRTLAYVGVEAVGKNVWGRLDLYTIPAGGGADRRLTDTPAPDDGPEYSPDGKWLYFNSELNAQVSGHAQCYRMKPNGTGIEQLTRDERVNWFPHVSPDGQWVVYLSFPPGTKGHPANKDIILRRMKPDGSAQADITAFRGGQGTINVNSWSPDSKRFAFVAYPAERE